MSESKFTKGPWEFRGLRPSGIGHINADGRTIVQVWDFPEAEANALLIVAAPSMIALLEKALPMIEEEAERRTASMNFHGEYQCLTPYWREMRELANEIEAEIKRAKGESHVDPSKRDTF